MPTTNIRSNSPRFFASRTNVIQSLPKSETYSASGFLARMAPTSMPASILPSAGQRSSTTCTSGLSSFMRSRNVSQARLPYS